MALSRALNHLVIGNVVPQAWTRHGRANGIAGAVPLTSSEFDGTVARLSDDLGLVRAEVERQLTRALERYQDARCRSL